MEHRSVVPVDNETDSTVTRTTVDGRSITYSLKVLQQPQRARACGQGAKSSADRRPVDPPPIVELTILQGEKPAAEDVTFTMNANYFLFATLEQARPIAQGRVSQDKSTPPVLTGTPVAGMVYLDRPKPAGYFIFPDLSVRHEGKYRLSFSLYEELKNSKDHDKMDDGAPPTSSQEQHVTHRLDVRSQPFHVFSAKKFPGLTESTSLSRMVAEQGCRVRIRRDVRMRRREPKGGSKEWDEYEDETAGARARQQSATPDPSVYSMGQTSQGGYMEPIPRPRSASNASHHSLGTSFSRRPSLQDIGQAYHQPQYAAAPHTPQHAYPPAMPYSASQPQSQQQFQQAPFVQQPAPMQPPPPQYQTQNFPAPPPPPPPQAGYYATTSAPPPPPSTQAQPQYTPVNGFEPASQPPRASIDYPSQAPHDFRRSSSQLIPPPPPPQGGYSRQPPSVPYQPQPPVPQHSYQQPPPPPPPPVSQHTTHQSIDLYSNTRPAPLEPLQPPARAHGAHTPTNVKPSFDLPPINTAMMSGNKLEASSPLSSAAPQSSYFSNTPTPQDTHKRSYGNVFSDRHQNGPLRQGARPSSYSQVDSIPHGAALPAVDDDDNASIDLDPETLGMHYRRADGRRIRRALPGQM